MRDDDKKVCAAYCVYDDDEWLRYSIASIYSSVSAILFFVSERPWNGASTDNTTTRRCIESFPDPLSKIQIVRGSWNSELEQRNFAAAYIDALGYEYILIIDADEIYDVHRLAAIISHAYAHPETCCWHSWFVIYWKSPGYRIDPPEKHHPPILLKSGTGIFVEYRNCKAATHELVPVDVGFCHHMSYARTDAQIRRKLSSFSHSHQVNPNWFEAVWNAWNNDHTITDLCPYNPGVFQRAVPVPSESLPAVLRDFK